MSILLLGLVALVAANAACTDVTSGSLPDGHSNLENEEPTPPKEVRWFDYSAIPDAVHLQREIIDAPSMPGPRRALASLYHQLGFQGAAAFYDASAALLSQFVAVPQPSHPRITWLTSEQEVAGQSADTAHKVADLVADNQLDKALDVSAQSLQRERSAQLFAEWSLAVLRKATREPDSVSGEALEIALRVLLTGLEEPSMPRPRGFIDRASGYEDLSNLFLALDDEVSALAAAQLGLRALCEAKQPDSEQQRRFETRIGVLKSHLVLPHS